MVAQRKEKKRSRNSLLALPPLLLLPKLLLPLLVVLVLLLLVLLLPLASFSVTVGGLFEEGGKPKVAVEGGFDFFHS